MASASARTGEKMSAAEALGRAIQRHAAREFLIATVSPAKQHRRPKGPLVIGPAMVASNRDIVKALDDLVDQAETYRDCNTIYGFTVSRCDDEWFLMGTPAISEVHAT